MFNASIFNRPTASKLKPENNVCLISIWTPEIDAMNYDEFPINFDGWQDSTKLVFNDVTHQGLPHWKLFNHDMAKQLVAFIYKNINSDFYIHCDAGMSRSVAVGCYLRDMWGYNLHLKAWPTDELRNSLVYNTLMMYK